jgi:predicted RNase H-like nuclease (RuvC/YqgF family)
MAMNVEAEIRELQRRVSEMEGSFVFLTRQVQGVHKDLLSFVATTEESFERVSDRFDRLDSKVDSLDRKIDSFDRKVDSLDHKVDALDRKMDAKVDGLAKALPGIIGDAVREVIRTTK